jgi:polyisoprenoid-binding protein YceI
MRRSILTAFAVVLFTVAAARAASAQRQALIQLDSADTQINFTLGGFPHTTTGSFKLRRGEIRVDPETGNATGSIVVDAASGATGIAMRDRRMKDGILEVDRYPEISFAPRLVRGHPLEQGAFTMEVSGVMVLHGHAHRLTLEAEIKRNGDAFTAATHFVIPYVRWGLKNPGWLFLTVSDEVAIDATTAGRVTWVQPR